MVEENADSLDSFMLDRDGGLQELSRKLPIKRSCLLCASNTDRKRQPNIRAGRQVRQGAKLGQKRAPDYPVIFAWSCFLLFIGVGAFVVGMAIHNEATAKPPAPHPRANLLLRHGRRENRVGDKRSTNRGQRLVAA
jgi:hypothetical protein